MRIEDVLLLLLVFALMVASTVFGMDLYRGLSGQVPAVVMNSSVSEQYILAYPSEQCRGVDLDDLRTLKTTGHSMQPTIFAHHTVLVKDYDPSKKLLPGDIVSVYKPDSNRTGSPVMHRVVAVYEDFFIMKGDYNDRKDSYHYRYSDISDVACGVLYSK